MNATIFGSGYVGLVTGACLADVGINVMCMDIDENKIEGLKKGKVPIYEPGLDNLIKENIEAGRLQFTTDAKIAVEHGLFQFIAVGTPPDENGSADLQYVLTVAENIAKHMQDYRIIIDKSTVPVGTADKVKAKINKILQERNTDIEFDVASNPEFLKEGAAIDDFMKPDRIIIGTDNPRTTELLRMLYEPFNRNHNRLIAMDIRSAELTKYAANAMLATKISFMNELANLAELVGADIENIRIGIGSDKRIGYNFIYPGAGYGGSCFPKDIKALEYIAKEVNYDAKLLSSIEVVNNRQKQVLFNKINQHFNNNLKGKTFALWGLAFKPNTDDMRDAPSRVLIDSLIAVGVKVQAYDPAAMEEAQRIYANNPELILCKSNYETLENADALIVITEWKNFRSPNFDKIKQSLKQAVIFDGRNIYNKKFLLTQGFTYYGIGR
jgi:UDPglucose 6-dehydrogenase